MQEGQGGILGSAGFPVGCAERIVGLSLELDLLRLGLGDNPFNQLDRLIGFLGFGKAAGLAEGGGQFLAIGQVAFGVGVQDNLKGFGRIVDLAFGQCRPTDGHIGPHLVVGPGALASSP